MSVQGTRPLAHTLSGGGLRTSSARESTYVPPRRLSPMQRSVSASDRASPMEAESTAQQYQSASFHANRIPLPHLERPVYVRFDERPEDGGGEIAVDAM